VTGCWVYDGHIAVNGYGKTDGKLVHRLVYEALVGPIPEGLQLDHLCRNRACYNPAHLEPVTDSENKLRSPLMGRANASKTHCAGGHPYDETNTYHTPSGQRQCRTCVRAAGRRYYARKVSP